MLLISYILLQSSLSARLGDRRQFEDILSRHEIDWYPRVGEEGFTEMKDNDWGSISPQTRGCWEIIRDYLLQERLVHASISSQDIRTHTCDILCRIEEMSSHSLNAVITPRAAFPVQVTRLGERACLVLVCLSVCVTSTPVESGQGSLFTSLNEQQMQQMVMEIQRSPLFPNQLTSRELWVLLESLEMLFCKDDQYLDCGSLDDDPSHEQEWVVQFQQEVFSSRWCVSQPTISPSSMGLKDKRRRQTISTTREIWKEASSSS